MIFAISPGSEGLGPERYVASLPFVVAPGATLSPFDTPISSSIGALSLRVEKLHHFYILSFGPFPTAKEATTAVTKLGIALLWLSLAHGVGIQYSKELGEVRIFEAPKPVPESEPMAHIGKVTGWTATDGYYDADRAIVRPEHKRLVRWENGQATITLGVSVDNFFASLQRAISFPNLEKIVSNDKLKLAIELYAVYRFELSNNAQLISLVTALEALLPDMEIGVHANNALIQAKEIVQVARESHQKNSSEWSEINRLLSRIGKLGTESIGTALRQFAKSATFRHPQLGCPDEISRQLRDAYSVRSMLLHEGRCDDATLNKQLSFLRDFVPRLLTALFEESAGSNG